MTAPEPTLAREFYVRDNAGNLNGPYDTAKEALLDHFSELPQPVREAIRKHVCRHGYYITNWYPDGVVRLAQGEDRHDLYVYVRNDGTVTKPRTRASAYQCILLREAQAAERSHH